MKGKSLNSDFYHRNPGDHIWWKDTEDCGKWLFSFDRQKVYNMYRDYPHNMTPREVRIFDQENPFWAEYFKDRKEA